MNQSVSKAIADLEKKHKKAGATKSKNKSIGKRVDVKVTEVKEAKLNSKITKSEIKEVKSETKETTVKLPSDFKKEIHYP